MNVTISDYKEFIEFLNTEINKLDLKIEKLQAILLDAKEQGYTINGSDYLITVNGKCEFLKGEEEAMLQLLRVIVKVKNKKREEINRRRRQKRKQARIDKQLLDQEQQEQQERKEQQQKGSDN